MDASMTEIIDIRKKKKALYVSLLNRGLNNLKKTEKQILHNLIIDEDIQLLLKNGETLE